MLSRSKSYFTNFYILLFYQSNSKHFLIMSSLSVFLKLIKNQSLNREIGIPHFFSAF